MPFLVLAVAAGLANASARAASLKAATPLYMGGLVVAVVGALLLAPGAADGVDALASGDVAGLVSENLLAIPFAIAIYLLVASAWQTYYKVRSVLEMGVWAVVAGIGVILLFAASDPKTAAFVVAGTVIVFSSLKVVQTDVLVHATVWLAGMLVGVAGIYLSLGAEFLAAVQILIYVGAVITLFLFTVMLTIPEEEVHGLDELILPPGVTVESVRDLEPMLPKYGVGPYKGFPDTNPRKPLREPVTLYGVSIADGVYGDETTVRRKTQTTEQEKES